VLDIGVIGTDLALAGRVEMRDGRALVTEPTTLGEPRLEARLADLTEAGKPQMLQWYLEKRRRGARATYLVLLRDAGLVEERSPRILGLFTIRRWYLTGGRGGRSPPVDGWTRWSAAPPTLSHAPSRCGSRACHPDGSRALLGPGRAGRPGER